MRPCVGVPRCVDGFLGDTRHRVLNSLYRPGLTAARGSFFRPNVYLLRMLDPRSQDYWKILCCHFTKNSLDLGSGIPQGNHIVVHLQPVTCAALTHTHTKYPTNAVILKLHFCTVCHNSDMFRSVTICHDLSRFVTICHDLSRSSSGRYRTSVKHL
jgi:hypothetical protein